MTEWKQLEFSFLSLQSLAIVVNAKSGVYGIMGLKTQTEFIANLKDSKSLQIYPGNKCTQQVAELTDVGAQLCDWEFLKLTSMEKTMFIKDK